MEVVQWRPFGEPSILGKEMDNPWNQFFNSASFPGDDLHERIPFSGRYLNRA